MAEHALRRSFYIAVKALRRNSLQTALTMLGMSIGVATLLTTIALGAGAQASIENQVRAAGMNVIVVTSGNYKMPTETTSDGETEEPAAFYPGRGGLGFERWIGRLGKQSLRGQRPICCVVMMYGLKLVPFKAVMPKC